MPSLYDALELDKNASVDDIRKAYLRLSRTNHPDKGGDPEKFKAINHANEILSNPERKQMYDMTGSEQEDGGGMGGGGMGGFPMHEMFMGGMGGGIPFGMGGMGSIFAEMFGGGMGGGGGPRRARKMPRGPDKSQDIPISLADFYTGRNIQIKFQQQRGCVLCKATGALKTEPCSGCKGAGMKMVMRQLGPGMIQQSVQPCNDCSGEGKRILQVCHECSGKKYRIHEKVLNANIMPGMPEGEKIRYVGECSDSAEYETPGDVILNLIRTNATGGEDFEWQGDDLHITHSIEMSEALLGFNAVIKGHPSGKDVSLSWEGGLLQHDMVLVAKGMGMPRYKRIGEFGDLMVHIDISISGSELRGGWTPEQRAALREVFPDWIEPASGGIPLNYKPA